MRLQYTLGLSYNISPTDDMTDTFTPELRSRVMSRIRSKNTVPELAVRKSIRKLGFRYKLHQASLAGKPDLVLDGPQAAVFVHGCFWHQHPRCSRSVMPKSRPEYWIPKLTRNVSRFRSVRARLKKEGWKVVTIWECETRKDSLNQVIKKRLKTREAK